MARTYICAEGGINHGGSVETAERLIDAAKLAGADAVKLQKRTVDVVFSPEELARPRESPFGTTNGDLKRGLEFGREEYVRLAAYARERGLDFTASCWDEQALAEVVEWCQPPWLKIASAVLTWPSSVRDPLLRAHAATGLPLVMSTGMCGYDEINEAITVLCKEGFALTGDRFPEITLCACTSTYPCADDEINLLTIPKLREEYGRPIGYSGHERGIATTVAAVALGAVFIERHITLDRTMWGSDQAASLEPHGFAKMVRDIRAVERAMGTPDKRRLPSEVPVMQKLRRAQ